VLFNSFTFLYFYSVVYPLYRVLPLRAQNVLLALASFGFYGAWDWKYLFLLWFSMGLDFWTGLKIGGSEDPKVRGRFLWLSVAGNLGVLCFFKYAGFFTGSGLALALPVGISFYTFQTLGYVIEVYRRRTTPCRNLVDYAVFIAYFPHLVAGPIMKARDLLPQVASPRTIDREQVGLGLWYLLYGYFLKTVVADNLVPLVKPLRGDVLALEPGQLLPIFYATTFMIYADFCGYSHIARGLGKLMGFDLTINFRMPFFAKNPADFWRRWHISLSDWFRDYVFTPLQQTLPKGRFFRVWTALAAMATLVLCGFWHGAAWNFVAFGFVHGLLIVAYYAVRKKLRGEWSRPLRALSTFAMFHVLAAAALLFITPEPGQWVQFLKRLVTELPAPARGPELSTLLAVGAPLLLIEWIQERLGDVEAVSKAPAWARFVVYTLLFAAIVLCGATGTHEFIYFQF